jgi:CheY-like chemotaxis protein
VKALAVDDDPIALCLLEKVLTHSGFKEVATAANAVDASQLIASASPPFDCLLLDFMMPKIEGDYLCHWVRQLPQYARTPILMVTAAGSKSHIDRAFSSGASDYITKPYSVADLEIRLKCLRKEIETLDDTSHLVAYTCAEEWESKADRVDFCKPLLIGGTPKELTSSALEKYVRQISDSNASDVCAFSFALQDAAKLHFSCTKSDFLLVLQAVAKAISANTPRPECFFSYVGCGSFAGVLRKRDVGSDKWAVCERGVRQSLSNLLVPGRSGEYLRVVPFACSPIPLSRNSPEKSHSILYRAIVEAEERSHTTRFVA